MKFKAQEQYYFGKLHDSNSVKFVRTPKRQIYLGSDLIARGIKTFQDFYSINPCNYSIGENISICVQGDDGQMKKKMTKTIIEPIKEETLADNITPLHQQNARNSNEDLIKVYQGQIDSLQKRLDAYTTQNMELSSKVIEQSQIITEGDVLFERLEEEYKELKDEYEAYKKEFSDIIKEARNPAPPSLGDRIGELAMTPEVMGGLSELVGLGATWLRNRVNGNQPGLKDAPPSHQERVISEDEEEVFQDEN